MAEQIQKNKSARRSEPTTVDPMPESIQSTTESSTLLDSIDALAKEMDTAGDDALLNAVRAEKVQVVAATGRSQFQSGESRAWTMGGRVD